ncbi:MAG TPA: hypothetical protein PKB03_05700 [Baekduia sp.]|nr:hypothetical protein [Baekduia sp.]
MTGFKTRALLLATCAAAGVGTIGAIAYSSPDSQPKVTSTKSPSVTAQANFAVFDSAAADSTGEQRALVHEDEFGDLYAVAREGQVCLAMHSRETSSQTCASTADALNGLPPQLTIIQGNRQQAYLLIPNGVASVLTTDDTGKSTTREAKENLVVLGANTRSASWQDGTGKRSEIRLGGPPTIPEQQG